MCGLSFTLLNFSSLSSVTFRAWVKKTHRTDLLSSSSTAPRSSLRAHYLSTDSGRLHAGYQAFSTLAYCQVLLVSCRRLIRWPVCSLRERFGNWLFATFSSFDFFSSADATKRTFSRTCSRKRYRVRVRVRVRAVLVGCGLLINVAI